MSESIQARRQRARGGSEPSPAARLVSTVMGVSEFGLVRTVAYGECVRLGIEYPEDAAELCRVAVSAAAAREEELTSDLLASFYPGRDLR